MAKKVTGYIKLQVFPTKANPSPPIGPALGQKGVNIMEFCKAFNAQTQGQDPTIPLPVVITVYADRSFTFITKTPPASRLILKVLNMKTGSKKPGSEIAGKISRAQLEQIATLKKPDLTAADLEAAVKSIAGTARSMGIQAEVGK